MCVLGSAVVQVSANLTRLDANPNRSEANGKGVFREGESESAGGGQPARNEL